MSLRILVVHPTDGVFVGYALGFAFFAKLDTAGQSRVPVFDDLADARLCVLVGLKMSPDDFSYHQIEVTDPQRGASAAEVRAAGFADVADELEQNLLNLLLYGDAEGQA